MAAAQRIEKAVPAIGGHQDEIGIGFARSFEDRFNDVSLPRYAMPRPPRDVRRNNRRRRSLLANMEQSKFSALTF